MRLSFLLKTYVWCLVPVWFGFGKIVFPGYLCRFISFSYFSLPIGHSSAVFVLLPSNRVTSDGMVTSDTSYYFILRLKYRKRNFNLKNCYVVTINLLFWYNLNTLAISTDNWFKQQEGDLLAAPNKKVSVSVNFVKIF